MKINDFEMLKVHQTISHVEIFVKKDDTEKATLLLKFKDGVLKGRVLSFVCNRINYPGR